MLPESRSGRGTTARTVPLGESCATLLSGDHASRSSQTFSTEVVDLLLEKLSTDDDFRELFQSDPRAALQQIGHETPERNRGLRGTDPVMCMVLDNRLASKEVIRAGRAKMKAALTSTLQQTVFALSAD